MSSFVAYRGWAAVLGVIVFGCSPAPSPTGPGASGEAPGATTGATGGGAPATPSVTGAWTSPSCGARGYARELALNEGGTFGARDLVSPCPPGAQCVWSGIIDTTGTYSIDGAVIRLTPKEGGGRPTPQPFPTTLTIDPATSAIVEALGDGTRCPYTRAAAK